MKRPHRAVAAPRQRRSKRASRPVIVIDPGHGGRDPGAVGAAGTLEKKITLATALELRRLLEATGHYRVVMTRTTDVFVSLAARVSFARAHKAALMIAIHANSSGNRRAHGASVWVRSGAADGGKVTKTDAGPSGTAKVANALVGHQAQPQPGSAWLQYTMIDNLHDEIRMDPAPARQARLYVLGLRGIPSVLLEMGFLSNRHDEALLNKARHRRVMAQAIRDAIEDYFAKLKHPDALRT